MMRIVFILFFLVGVSQAQALDYITLDWEFNTKESAYNLFVVDLDGDNFLDIVADSRRSGTVYALSLDGSVMWEHHIPGLLFDTHAGDFKSGAKVIGGSWTHAYGIGGGGESVYKYYTGHDNAVTVHLTDVDGDGRGEAVVGILGGFRGNAAHVLDSGGTRIAKYGFSRMSYPMSFYAVDLDGDKVKEILVGTAGYSINTRYSTYSVGVNKPGSINAYTLNGTKLWSFATEGGVTSISSHDLTGDGKEEVLVGSNKRFYALNSKCKLLWSHATGKEIYDIRLFDVDGDNTTEIILASDKVYVLKKNGVLSFASKKFTSVNSVDVADIDGDGLGEIVAGSAKVYLLDSKGKTLWSSESYRKVTGVRFADLNRDGFMEIIAGSQDARVRVFGTRKYIQNKRAGNLLATVKQLYEEGEYINASVLGEKTENLYRSAGDSAHAAEAKKIVDNSRQYLKATRYYDEGLTFLEEGHFGNVTSSANKALDVYRKLGDLRGMTKSNKLAEAGRIRPIADSNLSLAIELYQRRQYLNASDHAKTAYSAYSWIREANTSTEVEILLQKIEKHVEAGKLLESAERAYGDGDHERALEDLRRAEEIYAKYGDILDAQNVEAMRKKVVRSKSVKDYLFYGIAAFLLAVIVFLSIFSAFVGFLIIRRRRG